MAGRNARDELGPVGRRWRWPRARRDGAWRWVVAAVLVVSAAGLLIAGLGPGSAPADTPAAPPPCSPDDDEPTRAGPRVGSVGLPLRLADPGAATLLRAGDHVDVLTSPAPAAAADPWADGPEDLPGGEPDGDPMAPDSAGDRDEDGARATVLATDIEIIEVPPVDALDSGGLIYVSVTPEQARRIAGVTPGTPLTVTVRAA